MTEPNDNFESRLASLRPRAVTPALEAHISQVSTSPIINSPAPTRTAISLFWTTVAGGAIAASTILVLLVAQTARPPRTGGLAVDRSQKPTPILALASADWRWGDDLKINLNESRRLP